jgi:hypothetical protein
MRGVGEAALHGGHGHVVVRMQELGGKPVPFPHAIAPVRHADLAAEEMQHARRRQPQRFAELALRVIPVGLVADEREDLRDARIDRCPHPRPATNDRAAPPLSGWRGSSSKIQW